MKDHGEDDGGMDPGTAERLLDGEDVEAGGGAVAGLARLLTVAAAPRAGRPEDAQAALVLFRQERDGRHGRAGRRAGRRARPALTAAGAAAAVLALGGVVIAAQTSVLSHPFGPGAAPSGASRSAPAPGDSAPASRTHGSPPPASPGPRTSPSALPRPGHGTARSTAAASRYPSRPAAAGTAPATEDLRGLCEAYVKSVGQGKALSGPAQQRLDEAAGGGDEVGAYCARLLATPLPHGVPSAPHPANSPSKHGR